jgi:large subunit ribosomal protein L9
MQYQLLLVEDVDDLGRSGEIVKVKPGYARNFLLPRKVAVIADKGTLRMQARLQEERAKRAEVDKREAEALALGINGKEMTILVKVDQEGHMYGSVSALDIVHLFEKEGIKLERRNVVLPHPLKELGTFKINLRLKEGVPATIVLKVESETPLPQKEQKIEKPAE